MAVATVITATGAELLAQPKASPARPHWAGFCVQ